LYKILAGTPYLSASASFSVADGVTYNLQAVVNDINIEIFIDGVSYILQTEAAFIGATKHGVNIAQASPPVSGTTVDNFLVLGAAPSAPAGAAMLMML